MKIADVMVIDFEASGLACDSWPIEIGLAWLGPSGGPDPKVEFWSSMIRPESAWCESLWDPISEEIHGISLEEVKAEGRSAWDVAEEVWARIEGKILVSDAPSFDTLWFRKLLDAHPNFTPFVIHDFDGIAAGLVGEGGLEDVWRHLEILPAPHRAGGDAARLMKALVRA